VRALDAARRFRLALKACGRIAVPCHVALQKLQRDALADGQVRRLIDGSHAAPAEQALDTVLAGNHAVQARVLLRLLVGEVPARAQLTRRFQRCHPRREA
jgi:hypothetical protein